MTTDSHVVNSMSGRNPVGLEIDAEEIVPFVLDSVKRAVDDLSPAEVGAATETCEEVEVFGPGKIIQLTSLVSGIISNLGPFCLLFLLVAFFAVLVVCMIVL
jgi:putative membrane protein